MFGKRSIDKVLGDISRKIGQLRDLAEKHHITAQLHLDEIEVRTQLAATEASLRDRATRVAEKFEELLK